MTHDNETLGRRDMLRRALLGAGTVGLGSLATGLPSWILSDPLRARAETANARTLILLSTATGDPVNANVPGTYGPGLENVVHPASSSVAETPFMLGGKETSAARPWADLPSSILDRITFIHHGTYTNTHPNHSKVLRVMGATARDEMLVSVYAKETGPVLGSTQLEPIALSGTLLSFEGRTLAKVPPRALRDALGAPDGSLANLQERRDADIDHIYNLYKTHGSPGHLALLDRFARTRDEARSVSDALLGRLDAVENNQTEGRILAAPVLAAMNLSPVIVLEVPFGGDNHNDPGLQREADELISGLGHVSQLVNDIDSLRQDGVMSHEVVIASLNVFGRTLSRDRKGTRGRDHNGRHQCTFIVGDSINPGVVGGIQYEGRDWEATGFDSNTGESRDDGDIPYSEGFPSVAKTLGCALGVSETVLEEQIHGGKAISAALR